MRKFREQCWECNKYSVHYGFPYCNVRENTRRRMKINGTTRDCKDFLEKKKINNE